MPTVAIIGASADRNKFGNKAVRAFLNQGYTVYPVHPKAATIEGIQAYASLSVVPEKTLDCVSLYVPPEIGIELVDEIAKKNPGEVWLNPGAESEALIQKAEQAGLPLVVACSILGIGENPGKY